MKIKRFVQIKVIDQVWPQALHSGKLAPVTQCEMSPTCFVEVYN